MVVQGAGPRSCAAACAPGTARSRIPPPFYTAPPSARPQATIPSSVGDRKRPRIVVEKQRQRHQSNPRAVTHAPHATHTRRYSGQGRGIARVEQIWQHPPPPLPFFARRMNTRPPPPPSGTPRHAAAWRQNARRQRGGGVEVHNFSQFPRNFSLLHPTPPQTAIHPPPRPRRQPPTVTTPAGGAVPQMGALARWRQQRAPHLPRLLTPPQGFA